MTLAEQGAGYRIETEVIDLNRKWVALSRLFHALAGSLLGYCARLRPLRAHLCHQTMTR